MKYGSVCSGIEAATVAWHGLGWEPAWFSEIEKFPCSVLAHHYPNVPNLGDMTKYKEWPDNGPHAIDALVGGTPCQSFSVAGLRKGLADPRGNLMLTFGAIAGKYRPRWLVWENVPGVLSSNGGRDFGSFLGMLGQLGYGFAYRVLDAQYFGVAQRRRRVFVVGYLGDWRPAAAVLFERQSLQGNPSPSREAGERVAERVAPSPGVSSHGGFAPELSHTLKAQANDKQDPTHQSYIAHTLKGEGFDASEDGPGRGTPLVPVAFPWQSALDPIGQPDNISGTLIKNQTMAVCAPIPISTMAGLRHEALGEGTGLGIGKPGDPANTLSKAHSHAVAQPSAQNLRPDPTRPVLLTMRDGKDGGGKGPLLQQDKSATLATANNQTLFQPGGRFVDAPMAVRRLTPRECERLQGFPDDFTAIPHRGKPAADGPRYKALGNSMAVPVMAWIGQRIQSTEVILARP